MIKFDEKEQVDSINGALKLRHQINPLIDELQEEGIRNLCWLGIGGTYASCMQASVHMKEKSSMDFFVENAAEYYTTGNKRIGEGTLVVISSVTGTTEEMIRAMSLIKESGAKTIGFIDVAESKLADQVDFLFSYPMNEQLKFFMLADRIMYNRDEFPNYEAYYEEMDKYLAKALAKVEVKADDFALKFAVAHKDDAIHYFLGAGNMWGATYSYAMCYWEEQHWIRTKSIHSAEFLHGTLEIVDRDTNVTVFIGEDSQRELSERAARLLPRICGRLTVIDTKDYELEGIGEDNRGSLSHLVMRAITKRIDIHLEAVNCHPMEIRRYYRKLTY